MQLHLQLLLPSAPSALSKEVVIQPEEVTQLFTILTEAYLCAEYWCNLNSPTSRPSLYLSLTPPTDRWMCSNPGHLHIRFRVSQPFCKQLRAKSQLMGAGPDIDLACWMSRAWEKLLVSRFLTLIALSLPQRSVDINSMLTSKTFRIMALGQTFFDLTIERWCG